MDTLTVGPYSIRYDRAATVETHSRISRSGPEECGCWYCRNWAAGRTRLAPPAVRVLLDRLGIPEAGETEVCEVTQSDGRHHYGGWYTFVGHVEAPQDGKEDVAVDGWSLRFSEGSSYAVGAFAGLTTSELHFFVKGIGDFIAPLSDGARSGGGRLARVSGLFGTTGESRGRR